MARIKRRTALPLAFAGGVLGILVMASIAGATHPRPQGATPVRFSLVPAYKPCTAPNHRHGPPLAFPSCHPPAQASSFVTAGTPDANGAPAKFEGFFKFAVHTVAGPPPQSQLQITTQVHDVR